MLLTQAWLPGALAQCTLDDECHPPTENLVLATNTFRTLTVSSECGGNGTDTYTPYRMTAQSLDLTDFNCTAGAHPGTDMADTLTDSSIQDFTFENPVLQTYWQSENSLASLDADPTTEYVCVNFTDVFLVRYFRAIFVAPEVTSATVMYDTRPRAMLISRRAATDQDLTPWRYYAEDCSMSFPDILEENVDGTGTLYPSTTPVCIQKYYARDVETYSGWGYGRQQVSDYIVIREGEKCMVM